MSENAIVQEEIRLLKNLRAVRDFRPDPVPEAVLADIYEVARWSGSAENRQPWNLVVVRDRAMLDRLAVIPGYADHLAGAPLGIVLVMDTYDIEFSTYDEGRLAERIMLAAAAHGLGSCIGWWSGDNRETAKRLIGAPTDSIVRTVLAIGYPGTPRPQRPHMRKPLDEIIHQERYS